MFKEIPSQAMLAGHARPIGPSGKQCDQVTLNNFGQHSAASEYVARLIDIPGNIAPEYMIC